MVLLAIRLGWNPAVNYFSHQVSYIEPIFVVVIMAIAATRPILELAERLVGFFARLAGGKLDGTFENEGQTGPPLKWMGVRALQIADRDDGTWKEGRPINLFNGNLASVRITK